ncbi:hypothetical protein [Tepidiphilus sp. J10]|uniref:hypothetical protein n=1 Tax=Tepidiphilus sp. J10 TaxID=2502185 RepID=UPI00115F7411|nr:hypothetical protein [Tepidiphilus sp. J10]
MKKIFLTFADSRMRAALARITMQANGLGVYDYVLALDEASLDLGFREEFKERLILGSRGYGYWVWKPQIILQTLRQLRDGDILHYCDTGCHLRQQGKLRLLDYIDIVNRSSTGILAFQAVPPSFHDGRRLPDLREKVWCKADLAEFFGVRANENIMNAPAIGAGIFFIRKCRSSLELIEKWQQVYRSGFSLVDDSPSLLPNPPEFKDHRHDQSIFSILCKLAGVETVSAYEYWYPRKDDCRFPDWQALKSYPIHAARDRGIYRWWQVGALQSYEVLSDLQYLKGKLTNFIKVDA